MKNTIRCCISCILPCGALDVIRIVHVNGHVEEISGPVLASDIMKAYPKHILKKPTSPSDSGICPQIVIISPEEELQRGKIYFLVPSPAGKKARSKPQVKRKKKEAEKNSQSSNAQVSDFVVSDRYLSEILSENVSTQRDRRRGRAGVWRPRLESICETPSES